MRIEVSLKKPLRGQQFTCVYRRALVSACRLSCLLLTTPGCTPTHACRRVLAFSIRCVPSEVDVDTSATWHEGFRVCSPLILTFPPLLCSLPSHTVLPRLFGCTSAQAFDGIVALVISPTKYQNEEGGSFFGIDANFTGLAVVVGSTGRRRLNDVRPEEPYPQYGDVAIVANNGTRSYDDLMSNLEACSTRAGLLNPRDKFYDPFQSSRIRIKAHDNRVALDFHAAVYPGQWKRCATTAQVDMPVNWAAESYVGVVGQKRSNPAGLTFMVESIPNEPWETDSDGQAAQLITIERRVGATQKDDTTFIRERLALRESALREACSDSPTFSRCHPDGISVADLEWCLRKWGMNIPESCSVEIAAWKALVSGTERGARVVPPAGVEESPGSETLSFSNAVKDMGNGRHATSPGFHRDAVSRVDDHEGPLQLIDRGMDGNLETDDLTGRARVGGVVVEDLAAGRDVVRHNSDDESPHPGSKTAVSSEPSYGTSNAFLSRRRRWQKKVDGRRGVRPTATYDQKRHPLRGGHLHSHHRSGRGDSSAADDGIIPVQFRGGLSFSIGYLSGLMVIFFVKRAVKWLLRCTNGHRDGDRGDTSVEYQALRPNTSVSGSGRQQEGTTRAAVGGDYVYDDDTIVVTGTLVDPPPFVHL
ncbi:unnamed protein product [Scytosiphon promiscuus]